MCGIAGLYQSVLDFTEDSLWEGKINRMKNSLAHRGPDENDIFMSPHAAFAAHQAFLKGPGGRAVSPGRRVRRE